MSYFCPDTKRPWSITHPPSLQKLVKINGFLLNKNQFLHQKWFWIWIPLKSIPFRSLMKSKYFFYKIQRMTPVLYSWLSFMHPVELKKKLFKNPTNHMSKAVFWPVEWICKPNLICFYAKFWVKAEKQSKIHVLHNIKWDSYMHCTGQDTKFDLWQGRFMIKSFQLQKKVDGWHS